MVSRNICAMSATYKVNDNAIKVLKMVTRGLSTSEMMKLLGLSRQSIYIYLGVLRREGYIIPRQNQCPYEVTENGKNYLESADRV